MNHGVFVSHSSEDMAAADFVVHGLEGSGIRCWKELAVGAHRQRRGRNAGGPCKRGPVEPAAAERVE